MPLELVTIPCLNDNYAFLVHDASCGLTAVVDVPDAEPILAVLAARGWALSEIWLTHHHADHIQGADALRDATGARVLGAAADAHRLPALDVALVPEQAMSFAGQPVHVIDAPGHTVGHIAFHMPEAGFLFSADSLMAGGCGRLFEGTPAQMHASLQRLAALPPETLVCSGHEYTTANLRFALTLEPANPDLIFRVTEVAAARAQGRATVPSRLSAELATNPFLRAHLPSLKAAVGLKVAADATVFAEIRARKDRF